MLHDLYSYWLTVEPNTKTPQVHSLSEVLGALNHSYLVGEPYAAIMVFKIDGNEIRGEIDSAFGTVEEDDRLRMTVSEIAEKYPDYIFVFEENDEDDHSNAIRTEWRDGKQFSQDHARVVEPGTYDEKTITAILDFLKGHNETYIADMITRQFLENHTAPIGTQK